MSLSRKLPIALFDSGVGGLTVFKAVARLLPYEDLVYLGDTARVPYGVKSPETIIRYTLHAAQRLRETGIKMFVVACNTATAAALPALKEYLAPIPVLGVIEPGARAAVNASERKVIVVIGTEATINGKAYQLAIEKIDPAITVIARACTLFVPLAEEGWTRGEIAENIASRYLKDIFEQDATTRPDTLLLGCTHFPLLMDALRKVAGDGVKIVDSAHATALHVQSQLYEHNLLNDPHVRRFKFFTTDNRDRFLQTGQLFLESALDNDSVELLDL